MRALETLMGFAIMVTLLVLGGANFILFLRTLRGVLQ